MRATRLGCLTAAILLPAATLILMSFTLTKCAAGSGGGEPEPAATVPRLSERVMASKGYLPPGAPLKPPPRPRVRDGFLAVEFAQLAGFDFEPESGHLPPPIAALDGKGVEVVGVMYFAVEDPDRVTEFFLMPDHTVCCFGTPTLQQIVEVRLPAGVATEYVLDYYLVRGVLQIGPFYDDRGLPLCLYRIVHADVELLG